MTIALINGVKFNKKTLIEAKKFRKENSLPRLKGRGLYRNEIFNICFFPDWFLVRRFPEKGNTKIVGFPLSSKKPASTLHPKIEEFIDRMGSPVLFTTGSGVFHDKNFFINSARACDLLKVPAILVGQSIRNIEGISSKYCLTVEYADFDELIKRCCLVVHHGGIGTATRAIKAGIAQIIRPLLYDQPGNAYRIKRLGLGFVIMPKQYTQETIRLLIEKMIPKLKVDSYLEGRQPIIHEDISIKNACDYINNYIIHGKITLKPEKSVSKSIRYLFSI